MKRVFLTTSIPYVNGVPHIGHALELVQTDCMARAYRELGFDTFFLTGTDENAQKNVESAEKIGISVEDLVNKNSKRFENLKETLNLSYDYFIRTTSKKHKEGAALFWEKASHDIYKKEYTGLYCVGCESFYKDGEFENNICPNHNRKLEEITEENYFFRLSKYQDKIRDVIASDMLKIQPTYRKNEVLNFISKGLEDFSISRPENRMKGWGIPVPGDSSQRMYVWFDALTNYVTALDFATNGENFQKYWTNNPNRIHVIGKDIIKFHAIYWIGMLLSAEMMLPTEEFVHGFISSSGHKMSKTLGNVVDPVEMVKKFGIDAVRYYLLKEIPSLDDGDFSEERMRQLYKADLANELGNLVSRVTTMAEKDELEIGNMKEDESVEILNETKDFKFNPALERLWIELRNINKDINDKTPWKLVKDQREEMLLSWLKKLNYIGKSLKPFMPETAKKIVDSTSGKIKKSEPLFPRLTG